MGKPIVVISLQLSYVIYNELIGIYNRLNLRLTIVELQIRLTHDISKIAHYTYFPFKK